MTTVDATHARAINGPTPQEVHTVFIQLVESFSADEYAEFLELGKPKIEEWWQGKNNESGQTLEPHVLAFAVDATWACIQEKEGLPLAG